MGKLKDSGQRRTFESGAVRDRGELKSRPDLISPHAQMREGMIFALGAQKYTIRNWELGMPTSECLASAQRHIEQYKRGDRDEDHLAQARWNLGAIIHFEEEIAAGRLPAELDDMPKYKQQPTFTKLGYAVGQCEICHEYVYAYAEDYKDGARTAPMLCKKCRITKDGECILVENLKDKECIGQFKCPTCKIPLIGKPLGCPKCHFALFQDTQKYFGHAGQKIPLVELPYKNPAGTLTEDGEITFRDVLTDKYYRRLSIIPTFYICGPMRGYPRLNFEAFDAATQCGRSLGYKCISPAELDREAGIDPNKPETIANAEANVDTIIQRDINVIMALSLMNNDGIAVLPGWEKSIGARAEVALAKWRGLRIVSALDFKTPVEINY